MPGHNDGAVSQTGTCGNDSIGQARHRGRRDAHLPMAAGHNPMNKREGKKCGATTRRGTPCERPPLRGRTRCDRHGGKTPKGPDSPHWRGGFGHHGQARDELPDLPAIYATVRRDPELMRFRHDVTVLETMRRALTMRLAPERPVSAAKERRLIDLSDALRKLKEAEYRRIQVLQAMVPLEQHRQAQARTGAIVFEVVQERTGAIRTLLDTIRHLDPAIGTAIGMLNGIEWTQDMVRRYRVASVQVPSILPDVAGAIDVTPAGP